MPEDYLPGNGYGKVKVYSATSATSENPVPATSATSRGSTGGQRARCVMGQGKAQADPQHQHLCRTPTSTAAPHSRAQSLLRRVGLGMCRRVLGRWVWGSARRTCRT